SRRRRKATGKIAELPQAQRDLINQLLDDGATYAKVRREMAQHGVKLNGENISNWFDSGYQTHLEHKLWIQQMAAVRDGASDLLDGYDPIKFHQAANQLASIQIFKSLKEEKLSDDPQSHTRMLNVLARLGREALSLAKYQELSRPEPDDET